MFNYSVKNVKLKIVVDRFFKHKFNKFRSIIRFKIRLLTVLFQFKDDFYLGVFTRNCDKIKKLLLSNYLRVMLLR